MTRLWTNSRPLGKSLNYPTALYRGPETGFGENDCDVSPQGDFWIRDCLAQIYGPGVNRSRGAAEHHAASRPFSRAAIAR